MTMTLQQAWAWIAALVPQARLVGDGALPIARVHTDTRTLQPGDLFVALKGERFDAHDFLPQARAAGAVAAVAHGGLAAAGLPGIEVPDTLVALGALAAGWRSQFSLPLIAVTGSNGKTTVTQMVASILAAHAGEAAFATRGNLNNAIGVPQTLLRLQAAHRIGVVELGMNHPGEIAYLAHLARPTVALVNNAQREHLEFMHTVQAVAEENGAVLPALPPEGVAVFPHGDAYTALWRGLAAGPALSARAMTAALAAASAHICATYGVLLREPLYPRAPAELQEMTFPASSAIVTIVLLNVEWICAIPFATLRWIFFLRAFGLPAVVVLAALAFSFSAIFALSSSRYFFLFATVRRGPLRVRALVRVRCPLTGRPFL